MRCYLALEANCECIYTLFGVFGFYSNLTGLPNQVPELIDLIYQQKVWS